MSSRNSLQHTVSAVEPVGAALGDEWYNSATNLLYKRMVIGGVAQWGSITSASGVFTVSSGGLSTQIQFNDSGAFAGNANLTFDKLTGTLSVPNISSTTLATGSSTMTAATINGTVTSTNVVPFIKSYLWGWGNGVDGRTGLGNVIQYSSPKQVGSLSTWLSVTAGYQYSVAVKTDNTLWTWGDNAEGQLGLGDTNSRSSPVQLGALTNWLKVSGGRMHTLAIKTDGTLWSWGRGNNSQLGLGDVISRSSPVQVGALTTWGSVTAAYYSSMAINSSGALWSWGFNGDGQLGLNSLISPNSPTQVGLLANWKSISLSQGTSVAVKTDSTLWVAGANTFGQLGLGDTLKRSSPVQVGVLTNWLQSAAAYNAASVVKTDGTMWTWGKNSTGELGDGTTVARSSPVQVGLLTNWQTVSMPPMGIEAVAATKTDGTLWGWGYNLNGQLGLTDSTNRSSPVQVGLLTTWTSASINNRHTMAIASDPAGNVGSTSAAFSNIYAKSLTGTVATGVQPNITSVGSLAGLTIAGTLILQQSQENYTALTGATGTVVHNFSLGGTFYHTGIVANFTANITNLPSVVGRVTVIALALVQGVTPFICNGFAIGGVVQTIRWAGGSAPTGTASRYETQLFTIVQTGASTYTVTGQLNSYA